MVSPGGNNQDENSFRPTPLATTPTASNPTPDNHFKDCNPNFPKDIGETDAPIPAVTLPETTSAPPPPPPVTPTMAPSVIQTDALATKNDGIADESSAHQANTQSGTASTSHTGSFVGVGVVGLIAAVAMVGTVASRMKKAREADAALATPGDSNIHIEIRRTPTGGSTIL